MREEVLAFRQKHLPEDHPDHLKALSRLALSKHAAGDHSEGVKIQENVLALSRKALGDSHPDTIALMLDLAVRYPIRHYGASALRKEALTLLTERYGEEHRFVLRAVESLADFCVATGAAKEAAPLAATALRLSRKIHGADSETTLNAIYRLAACEADENRLANAMTLTESALELNIKLNGRAHPRTTSTRASLAIYSHLLGSPARAVKLQEKVLRQTAEIHGTDSPQYLDAMSVMAYYKLAEGNHEEARDLQKNTLEKMSQVLPATASSRLMAIRGLAACYTVLGETEKRAILQSEFEKLQLADRKMLTFQPGVDNGHGAYDSTHYIRIQANAPHEQENHLEIAVQSKPKTQAMLHFGDIFGDKPGQIPLGSRIYSAKLSLTVNNSGVTPELYQMAGEWMSDKLTFSNFKLNGNDEPGVQLDGREAYAIPMVRAPHGQRGRIAINVTASVQNWADGERNLGWLFTVPQGTNAWGARNTTWTTPSERPALQVTFDPRETTPTSREDYRALATSRSRIGTALADDRQLLIVAMNRPQKPDTIDALTLIALQAWFDQAAALQYSRQSALARANTGRTTMNPAHPARILAMRPIDNAANQATVLQMARSGLQTAKRKRLNLSIYPAWQNIAAATTRLPRRHSKQPSITTTNIRRTT
jgi:tetratricopeptide (TPR) repeat protein